MGSAARASAATIARVRTRSAFRASEDSDAREAPDLLEVDVRPTFRRPMRARWSKLGLSAQRAARRMLCIVMGLVLLTGMLRAGSVYLFCAGMDEVVSTHCCERKSVADSIESPDCCEVDVLSALPAAAPRPQNFESAEIVAQPPQPAMPVSTFGRAARGELVARLCDWARGWRPPSPSALRARLMVFLI